MTEERKYYCNRCDRPYDTMKLRDEHMLKAHPDMDPGVVTEQDEE